MQTTKFDFTTVYDLVKGSKLYKIGLLDRAVVSIVPF